MDPKLANGYTRQFFRQCAAQTATMPASILAIRRDLSEIRSKSRRAESFAGIVGRHTRQYAGKTTSLLSRDQQNRVFSLAHFDVGESRRDYGESRRDAMALSQCIVELDSKADVVRSRQLHFPLRFSFHLISRLQERGVIENLTFDSMLQLGLRSVQNYRYLNRVLPKLAPGDVTPVIALPVDNPATGAVGLIVGKSLGRSAFNDTIQPRSPLSRQPASRPDVFDYEIVGATADTYLSQHDMPPKRVFVSERLHEIERHRPPRDELHDLHYQVELQSSLDDDVMARIRALIQDSFGPQAARPPVYGLQDHPVPNTALPNTALPSAALLATLPAEPQAEQERRVARPRMR